MYALRQGAVAETGTMVDLGCGDRGAPIAATRAAGSGGAVIEREWQYLENEPGFQQVVSFQPDGSFLIGMTWRPDSGAETFEVRAAAAAKLAEMLQRRAWVPVGVRLPTEAGAYLCQYTYTAGETTYIHQSSVNFWPPLQRWTLSGGLTVTHWQPLPAGPEEGA